MWSHPSFNQYALPPDSGFPATTGQSPAARDFFVPGRRRVQRTNQRFTRSTLAPLAEILARQFIQRWDMYPQQLSNGRWLAIHEPLHKDLLIAHLRGVITLGAYLLDDRSQGRLLVLDADDKVAWQWLVCVARSLYLGGVTSYLEASRRGGHLWFFLSRKCDGRAIRQFGWGLLAMFGIDKDMVELFPKQDVLRHGPGSQIRLPFGIHQKSKKRYGFYYPTGQPVAATLREQLHLLAQPETVDTWSFDYFRQHGAAVAAQRRKRSLARAYKPAGNQSHMAKMAERIKSAISVRQFVGQYVALSQSGQGLCPFHDDHQPSFSVNDAENYWYCFACEQGGSIIDFWMYWRKCDFVTAIDELSDFLHT